jgi:hypothetical protein
VTKVIAKPEERWTPPPVAAEMMRYEVGTSLIAQFAGGHDFAGVLRELIQNEFDAGGSTLSVELREDSLVVSGNGRGFDASGWRRLKVMLGTGQIAGGTEFVEPKANGIGSKNFGLRSLFLVGDTIHIRSNGKMTSIDWRYGTYPEPLDDKESAGRRGVEIVVPYRTASIPELPAFDKAHETAAVQQVATTIAAALTKLATPERGRSLEHVIVNSVRSHRQLMWSQRARAVPCGLSGAMAILRTIHLEDNQAGPSTLTELEFARAVPIPTNFREKKFPSYFARPGRRTSGLSH